MIRKFFNRVNEWIEDLLRGLVGRMTPDRRVILILSMLVVFGGLSIYMTFSSFYNFGKKRGEKIQMEHIERLQIELQQIQHKTDSLKQLNNFHHERK